LILVNNPNWRISTTGVDDFVDGRADPGHDRGEEHAVVVEELKPPVAQVGEHRGVEAEPAKS
jgi:hypothetical protein